MKYIFCLFCLFCALPLEAAPQRPVEKMTFLDNGKVKVGCDLSLGGAITHLSTPGKTNMVNSHDLGRQVQMSYYSGPSPLIIDGKRPAAHWAFLGWNPIQSGDHGYNPSRVQEYHNDGKRIRLQCVPMLWPHDNIPAECVFEMDVKLDGYTVEITGRLKNKRKDKKLYPARDQELPAVYLNGPYHRLFTYSGAKPFTAGPMTQIVKKKAEPGPWSYWFATENWAALVNDDNFGVGVWHPGAYRFVGGFSGAPGKGGTKDAPTGYIAPLAVMHLDHNITHEYRTILIVGSLADIRQHIHARSKVPKPPHYVFTNQRLGWSHHGFGDTGWPIKGKLDLRLTEKSGELVGPVGFWQAKEAPTLTVEAGLKTRAQQGRIYWATLEEPTFAAKRSVSFAIKGDGKIRSYTIPLSKQMGYVGVITQLRLDPIEAGESGDGVEIKAIGFTPLSRGSGGKSGLREALGPLDNAFGASQAR